MKTFAHLGFTKMRISYRSKLPKHPIKQSSVDGISLQGLSLVLVQEFDVGLLISTSPGKEKRQVTKTQSASWF